MEAQQIFQMLEISHTLRGDEEGQSSMISGPNKYFMYIRKRGVDELTTFSSFKLDVMFDDIIPIDEFAENETFADHQKFKLDGPFHASVVHNKFGNGDYRLINFLFEEESDETEADHIPERNVYCPPSIFLNENVIKHPPSGHDDDDESTAGVVKVFPRRLTKVESVVEPESPPQSHIILIERDHHNLVKVQLSPKKIPTSVEEINVSGVYKEVAGLQHTIFNMDDGCVLNNLSLFKGDVRQMFKFENELKRYMITTKY